MIKAEGHKADYTFFIRGKVPHWYDAASLPVIYASDDPREVADTVNRTTLIVDALNWVWDSVTGLFTSNPDGLTTYDAEALVRAARFSARQCRRADCLGYVEAKPQFQVLHQFIVKHLTGIGHFQLLIARLQSL